MTYGENSTRELILAEMQRRKETWNDVEHIVVAENPHMSGLERDNTDLDALHDTGFGSSECPYFTVWTKNYVYFPGCYDGSEWCASVPRHPCDEATEHVGGG